MRRDRTSPGRRCRASTRSGRRAGAASPAPACCRSGPCASCPARWPATGSRGSSGRRRRARRSARCAAGLSSRQPQAAVGGEGLLRREVIGVGCADVDGQAAGARGGVDQDERVVGRRTAARSATITPVEVSLCAQATTSQPLGDRVDDRRVAGLGGRRGPASSRNGAPRGDLGELGRELAEASGAGARSRTSAEGGGVPERRRAAVAERDLVAVGQREQLAQAARGRGRRASLTGSWRCEVPMTSAPSRRGARAARGGPSTGRSRSGRRRA